MNEMGWGLYVGQIARIRIRLHWLLLVWWAFELSNWMKGVEEERAEAFGAWLLGISLMFGSILLHELGHCFAARRVGGAADDVLLWPLGGLAYCHVPDYWKAHLAVAAGGPLVTLAILGLSFSGFTAAEWLLGGPPPSMWYYITEFYLVKWNLYILIFNLIPLYPMDGGRILHAAAWGFFSRARGGYAWGGQGLASRLTLRVSYVTAALLVVYGITQDKTFVIIIAVWAFFGLESLKRGD
ncbi:MAG TPA: hypothetical protein VMT52_12125 [Planctomycetota bacterium]|nr:hypothetical protein [Planctomycetota bacterium]